MNIAPIRPIAPQPVPINGPSRITLVTAATGEKNDGDGATLSRSSNDEFRGVQIRPVRLARRQTAAWRGLSGEVIQIMGQDPFESHYQGPCHLLILYAQA